MRESRLVIDCRMYRASGIGIYLQNILRRLGQYLPENEITLLGYPEDRDAMGTAMPGARVELLRSRIYTIREQLETISASGRGRAAWWSPHFNVPLFCRGRMVVTVHDLYHLSSPDIQGHLLKRLYSNVMFAAVRRQAHRVICVSQFTADELQRLLGIESGRVQVIPNGLDEGWFGAIEGVRQHERPYFLFVGNVKPNKNIKGLIAAFKLIAQDVPHDVVVVGKKEGFITGDAEAVRMAESCGGRVKFTGFVDFEELRTWYKDAAALVFPSFYEGFGFPPLEAMASGCPVIASRAASLPEVCGEAALYCDPADPSDIARAMLRVVREPQLRDELVAVGATQARKYSWSDVVPRTAAVLEEAMRGA